MDPLRRKLIRLAANFPPGPDRDTLLRLITAEGESSSFDPLGSLQKLLEKHELTPEDLFDLASFARQVTTTGQPTPTVKKLFKGWWGSSLPAFWQKIPSADLETMIGLWHDSFPLIVPHLQNIVKPPKAQKTGRTLVASEGGSPIGLVAVAAAAHVSTKGSPDKDREERQERAKQRDNAFNPQKGYTTRRYSQRLGKDVPFEGPSYEEFEKWSKNEAYEDHKWACEKIGTTPQTAYEFSRAYHMEKLFLQVAMHSVEDTIHMLREHKRACELATHVRKAISTNPDDIKRTVEKALNEDLAEAERKFKPLREQEVQRLLDKEDEKRLTDLFWEERSGGGFLDKMLRAVGASRWADQRAGQRAETKHKQEKSERIGPRSYEEYRKEKEQKGGQILTKQEWETRYKR